MATRRPLVLASGVVREMPTGDTVPVTNGGTGTTTSTGTGSVVLSASPTFTGAPLAPTPPKEDDDTSIATTHHVKLSFVSPSTGGVLDWNDTTNTMPGVGPTLLDGNTSVNGPSAVTGIASGWFFHPLNIAYSVSTGGGNTTQFAVAYGNRGDELLMRGRFSGTWGNWSRFLTHLNFNSYAPALDGTGATGSWGISITGNAATSSATSGNAATATTLATARTIAISGPVTGTATSFNGSANITIPVTAVNMSDAAISGSLPATKGGTGQTVYAVGDVLYASTTTALSKLAAIAVGNVLRSGGVGVAPAWGKVVMTTDVSGILPAPNGGTGQGVYAVGDLLYASTTTALSRLADVAVGNVLRAGGVGVAPAWGKAVLTTDVSGVLPNANGGTGTGTYSQGDILYASVANTLSKLNIAASGNVLRSGSGIVPAWGKVALTTDVSGQLPIANGGTGATTAANALTALGAVAKAGDVMTGDLSIEKSSNANLVVKTTSGFSALIFQKSASGFGNYINGRTGTSERWQVILGTQDAESGSNAGSDFAIARFTDAGAPIDEVIRFRRSDAFTTFSGQIYCEQAARINGYLAKTGVGGGFGGNVHNWFWSGSSLQAWVDSTNVGNVTLTSDERVKHTIDDLVVDRTAFLAIRTISYRYQNIGIFTDDGEHWGFSANNLLTCMPIAVHGTPDAVQEDGTPAPMSVEDRPILAATVNQVQQLIAEVQALRSELDLLKGQLNGQLPG